MQIILTSTGTQDQKVQNYIIDLTLDLNKTKLLFIPTAGNETADTAFIDEEKIRLVTLGFNLIEFDLAGKNKVEVTKAIKENDIIFVTGGAPFYLLREIRSSGFSEAIKSADKDKIYIGQSAGSSIACPTAEMGLWKNPDRNTFGLTDFSAIGLVDFLFFGHHKEKYESVLESKRKELNIEIYGVSNSQAIGVLNGKKTFMNF